MRDKFDATGQIMMNLKQRDGEDFGEGGRGREGGEGEYPKKTVREEKKARLRKRTKRGAEWGSVFRGFGIKKQ